MAGAFNIDVEAGLTGQNLKIYCASLTDNWTATCTYEELAKFHQELSSDESVTKQQVHIGSCPKAGDVNEIEEFLSILGCTSQVVKLKVFHEFLKIPNAVRDALAFAKHKPFGNTVKEGWLQRHPRYIKRSALKKWVRLTQDERGSSLVCYPNENSSAKHQASIKLSKQTDLRVLKEIQYAFVLKSGKRQWVLQANGLKDFNDWINKLSKTIQDLGGKVNLDNLNSQSSKPAISSTSSSNEVKALQEENEKLRKEIENWKRKYLDLQQEEKGDEIALGGGGGDANAIRKELVKQFTKEKEELIRDYEIRIEDLRTEKEELHKQLETKVANENGANGLKGLLGSDYKPGELQAEIDAEKKQLDGLTEQEQSQIKFEHEHLHKHLHKHIHHHHHRHIHDHTKEPTEVYTNTHTVTHTITHTNTQFRIKKGGFIK